MNKTPPYLRTSNGRKLNHCKLILLCGSKSKFFANDIMLAGCAAQHAKWRDCDWVNWRSYHCDVEILEILELNEDTEQRSIQ